jgi:SprT protein
MLYDDCMIDTALQNEIATKLKRYYDVLALNHPKILTAIPFNQISIEIKRLGKTSGIAYLHTNKIELNSDYFKTERDSMLNRTLPHELCHLVAWHLCQDRGHGRYWKYCMRLLGLTPNRCHTYDSTHATLRHHRKFVYGCSCTGKEHMVGIKIHNKIGIFGKNYTCKQCGVRIKFVRIGS